MFRMPNEDLDVLNELFDLADYNQTILTIKTKFYYSNRKEFVSLKENKFIFQIYEFSDKIIIVFDDKIKKLMNDISFETEISYGGKQ